MSLFTKKRDPIAEREQVLQAQIATLEVEIKKLNQRSGQIQRRETAVRSPAAAPRAAMDVPAAEPVFEPMDRQKVQAPAEASLVAHYNEDGVRKFDLAGAMRRVSGFFRGADTNNPRLVSYLAAGSIQGLRPLRYERRVARNRFIFLSVVFFLLLWGILAVILRAR